ncbi:MAG: alanine racemase [Deltaproteobacteria bacterium]|nr:alanine racemase [Deltaproteobacteria bacterium]
MDHSRNSVVIDQAALAHNFNQVRSLVGPQVKIMGVVKTDAYGHGLVSVSKALARMAVDCLGVAHFHEAVQLRESGLALPVFILSGIRSREEARAVIEHRLSPVFFDLPTVEIIAEECVRLGKRASIHVKVDTGMGRLGILQKDLVPFLRKVISFKSLDLGGFISHLSSADDPDRCFTNSQIENFADAIETARAMGFDLPLNSLANSAGVMSYPESHFEMVRPGIMLYGGLPSPDFRSPVSLRPVMSFKAAVLQVRNMSEGIPVGYGRTYYTKGDQKIAVISAGYGDGLPRRISNRGQVLIRGRKAGIVGRVCMNLIMADVSAINGLEPGDEAVFLGCQAGSCITGDDVARWAETISYEVFCSIGQRSKRSYGL